MIQAIFSRLMDVSVHPDFAGLPENLTRGLIRLTDNAAALLLLISGLGIVISITGMVVGSWMQSQQLSDRSRHGLIVSAGAGAMLFVAVAVANYAIRTFQ
jgi:uncharacterized membrane protein YpjA